MFFYSKPKIKYVLNVSIDDTKDGDSEVCNVCELHSNVRFSECSNKFRNTSPVKEQCEVHQGRAFESRSNPRVSKLLVFNIASTYKDKQIFFYLYNIGDICVQLNGMCQQLVI